MNWRWIFPAAGVVLFVLLVDRIFLLALLIGFLTLGFGSWAASHSKTVQTEHLAHGHKEGDLVPQQYRVVASARKEPIERPWPKQSFVSGLDEPQQLTRWVSGQLGPAILQHAGLVLYRESEEDARRAEQELHALLDPIFPEPVETRVERWNEDLGVWQRPDLFGGNTAAAAALAWEARVKLPDKRAAGDAARRIRESGEVWVAVWGRHVAVAAADESSLRSVALSHPELAGAGMRVRRLNRVTRPAFLAGLYDRRQPKGGWLEYDEPAAA